MLLIKTNQRHYLQSWPKGFGTPFFTCFSMEFTAKLRHTLINTNKIFFHPPWTKLRSLAYAKYVKSVWLVTPNTVQGGGGPETQSIPKILTRIVDLVMELVWNFCSSSLHVISQEDLWGRKMSQVFPYVAVTFLERNLKITLKLFVDYYSPPKRQFVILSPRFIFIWQKVKAQFSLWWLY